MKIFFDRIISLHKILFGICNLGFLWFSLKISLLVLSGSNILGKYVVKCMRSADKGRKILL